MKISNGKWSWFSYGISGTSALDYLVKVKDTPFMGTVERIVGQTAVQLPVFVSVLKQEEPKALLRPRASRCATHVVNYLAGCGIDHELINFCIQTVRLYESGLYHNVVDRNGKVRYANLRSIGLDFIGDANSNNKHYSFGIPAVEQSDTLHLLFESAIGLLSYGMLLKLEAQTGGATICYRWLACRSHETASRTTSAW